MSNDTYDSRAKILAIGAVLCWSTVATAFKLVGGFVADKFFFT